jgi:hypothetical protein
LEELAAPGRAAAEASYNAWYATRIQNEVDERRRLLEARAAPIIDTAAAEAPTAPPTPTIRRGRYRDHRPRLAEPSKPAPPTITRPPCLPTPTLNTQRNKAPPPQAIITTKAPPPQATTTPGEALLTATKAPPIF